MKNGSELKALILEFYKDSGEDMGALRDHIAQVHGEEFISRPYLHNIVARLCEDGLLASNRNVTRPVYKTSKSGRDYLETLYEGVS